MKDLMEWFKNIPDGYEIKKIESIGRSDPIILMSVQEARDEKKSND